MVSKIHQKCVILREKGVKSKDAGIVSEIRKNMDSFCKSMYRASQIWIWKDLYHIVHTNPANFQKIQPVFTNPHESSSSGEDGDVVGLGLPFSTESEKESE
jgi:hypothetical protein